MLAYKCMAVLFIVGIVQAVPAPGRGALVGCCNTNDDCLLNECCVSFTAHRGKRAIGKCKNTNFTDGHCMKLGNKKSSCLVDNNIFQNIYQLSCPCASGLTCRGNGVRVIPQGETGECVRGY
ncbi:hypothetical protein ACF0H5_021554 [Mactra antiquata]